MARPPAIPDALRAAPFRLATARRHGLSASQLRGRAWRRILFDVYACVDLADSVAVRAAAVALVLPPGAAVSGYSAAWLLGVDIGDPASRLSVTVPVATTGFRRQGLQVFRSNLGADDLVVVAGVPVTSGVRTAFDIGRRQPVVEGVAALDALAHAGVVTVDDLEDYLERHVGWPGTRRLRSALQYTDPLAESPMESRLRMIAVLAGLGSPQSQVEVYDANGFIARLDLLLDWVAFEYDGATHRASIAADLRRRNRLVSAGLEVLQFTASDVLRGPERVVWQLRRALDRARSPSRVLLAAREQTVLRPRLWTPRPASHGFVADAG